MSDKTEYIFPVNFNSVTSGISLRDWFAGMALQGICVSCEPEDAKHNAIVSYVLADAMLKAREQKMPT